MDLLPQESVVALLRLLSPLDIYFLQRVNRYLNLLCQDELLWKFYCSRDFNTTNLRFFSSWKEMYKDMHITQRTNFYLSVKQEKLYHYRYKVKEELERLYSEQCKIKLQSTSFTLCKKERAKATVKRGNIIFTFPLSPSLGATRLDFVSFFTEWREKVNETNKLLSIHHHNIGLCPHYKIA